MTRRPSPPRGYRWRSKRAFVIATVGVGLFSDLFLYGIVVPVMPFLLRDRLGVAEPSAVQAHTARQLAAYAGSSVLFALPVGWAADRLGARKAPFLVGVAALLASTALLCAGRSLAALIAARLLQGLSVAIVWAVGFATIQDLVGSAELGSVTGAIFSFVSAGELVAPALGGFLYDRGGMGAIFALSAAVLLVDIAMRLLMLDKLEMDGYEVVPEVDKSPAASEAVESVVAQGDFGDVSETSPLLVRSDETKCADFRLPENAGWLAQNLPVLYCMRDPRLSMAMVISLVQGVFLGVIDATLPIELSNIFSFSSNQVGMVFVCLMVPFVGLGRPAGWAVDRYGSRALATTGYLLMTLAIGLLSLPSLGVLPEAAKLPFFCTVLALNGVALAMTGPISFVEAGSTIESYHLTNPGFFGKHGPYAQLHGLNSLFFFAGLAIGPLAGGWISEAYSFHTMALASAGVAAAMVGLVLRLVGKSTSESV
ncbi:membrane transporter [Cordyceps fumosorosea ARSEF 2679]|uniref:Membrane transporter n=1 Tax=Cordyceps fumosorosea (strain ARSEF 2679) TaxID=1081104 RepID=A0A167LMR5_CORFA|nr:membrane transporter [Cordyceps fumosorosea ARSEF 2679]OAA53271.1 membrane transporter [Cordyceps fumosorosea ARSEF 2679]